MSDGTESRIGWGILLGGKPSDLEVWQEALKHFDPCIIKTDEGLILRSRLLDSATTSSEAHEFGKTLLERLNGALGVSRQAGMVRLEKVVEFLPDGSRHSHVIAEVHATDAKDQMSVTIAVHGPDGNPLPPPPPQPSAPQRWLEIAAEDRLLADALTYFGHGESWFDTYKALECIEDKCGGENELIKLDWAKTGEIKRLKKTANYYERHASQEKRAPPKNPMELAKARELVARLIACAFGEAHDLKTIGLCESASPLAGEGRSPARLIGPDQRRLSQDMAAHGLLELSFCRRPREVEFLVKGVKLEKIAVASDRRSGTAVARALPVVQPFAGSCRKRSHAFRKAGRGRRDVEKHPVNPDHPWGGRIRGVGIVDDQGETFRSRWEVRPGKRRRHVFAVAGVAHGDLGARRKGGRFEFQRHPLLRRRLRLHRLIAPFSSWRKRPNTSRAG